MAIIVPAAYVKDLRSGAIAELERLGVTLHFAHTAQTEAGDASRTVGDSPPGGLRRPVTGLDHQLTDDDGDAARADALKRLRRFTDPS